MFDMLLVADYHVNFTLLQLKLNWMSKNTVSVRQRWSKCFLNSPTTTKLTRIKLYLCFVETQGQTKLSWINCW